MYYCRNCEESFSGDDLERRQVCFEDEYGVSHLFPDKHYHTVYACPNCHSEDELDEAIQCEQCGEWLPEDEVFDTTEYINGGCGYCCQQCIDDGDMRAI